MTSVAFLPGSVGYTRTGDPDGGVSAVGADIFYHHRNSLECVLHVCAGGETWLQQTGGPDSGGQFLHRTCRVCIQLSVIPHLVLITACSELPVGQFQEAGCLQHVWNQSEHFQFIELIYISPCLAKNNVCTINCSIIHHQEYDMHTQSQFSTLTSPHTLHPDCEVLYQGQVEGLCPSLPPCSPYPGWAGCCHPMGRRILLYLCLDLHLHHLSGTYMYTHNPISLPVCWQLY